MANGIGTITTSTAGGGGMPSAPVFMDRISFPGDGNYTTGGTVAFEASFRAKIGENRTIIDVIAGDCGNNKAVYDRTNDKLKVLVGSTGAEVANATDLSGTTFNVLVISK
jgi:hypothetical protein